MKTETVCKTNDTTVSSKLYLAFELSNTEWKLGFTTGSGQAARLKVLKARNLGGYRSGKGALWPSKRNGSLQRL